MLHSARFKQEIENCIKRRSTAGSVWGTERFHAAIVLEAIGDWRSRPAAGAIPPRGRRRTNERASDAAIQGFGGNLGESSVKCLCRARRLSRPTPAEGTGWALGEGVIRPRMLSGRMPHELDNYGTRNAPAPEIGPHNEIAQPRRVSRASSPGAAIEPQPTKACSAIAKTVTGSSSASMRGRVSGRPSPAILRRSASEPCCRIRHSRRIGKIRSVRFVLERKPQSTSEGSVRPAATNDPAGSGCPIAHHFRRLNSLPSPRLSCAGVQSAWSR